MIFRNLFNRVRATSNSKWCSHISTSELSTIGSRSRGVAAKKKPPDIKYVHNKNAGKRSMSVQPNGSLCKLSISALQQKKVEERFISMITAYDYTSALLADNAGFDILLVGDSLGMVQLGYDGTEKVTMDDMLHHCKAVARTSQNSLLVGDLPFGSYLSPKDAVQNACRLVKEGGMDAVKLEGGKRVENIIAAVVESGIPVQGHIGLTPQTASQLGGFKVQGKSGEAAAALYDDALALQKAGCFSIVLECVPEKVATEITNALDVPTIGIGAGRGTNGQVQVFHDVIGMYDRLQPKFAKQYAHTSEIICGALQAYREEVEQAKFPGPEHVFKIRKDQLESFRRKIGHGISNQC